MTAQETNVTNAAESTLSSSLSAAATTINVTDTSSFPSVPFYAVIEPDVDAKREVVLVDSSKTATTFVLSSASKRGQDGTTDTTHSAGVKVVCVPIAALWRDINDRVDTAYTAGGTDVAVADGGTGASTAAGARTNLGAASSTHAATHSNGGTDEVTVENLGAAATDTALVLKPDGSGGVTFGADSTFTLTSEGFRAYRSGTTQSIAGNTLTTVIFNAEDFDEGADYNTSTGEWTVPATGWYDVATAIYINSIGSSDRVYADFAVNGSETFRFFDDTGFSNQVVVSGSFPMKLTAADVVTVRVIASDASGASINAGTSLTYFTAKRRY